jgi:DNA-binding MarR family transcriptional regulator
MDLDKFRKAIRYIRKQIHGDLAIPQLEIFLYVAENEGISLVDIQTALDMSQGAVSRNCSRLSRKIVIAGNTISGLQDIGYDLIEKRNDAFSARRKELYLTTRGKEVVRGLSKVLE